MQPSVLASRLGLRQRNQAGATCGLVFGLLTLRLEQQVGRGLGNDMSPALQSLDRLGILRGYTYTHTHTRSNTAVTGTT